MDVSVIIINYNTFQLTCTCIESVIKYSQGFQYEIILVDNASSECNPNDFLTRFPSIILVKSDVNDGFSKGNNRGIEVAKGKYILLLNSDTELTSNAILPCLEYLQQNKKTAVVTTKLIYPDGKIQHTCQRFPNIVYNLLEKIRFQKFFPRLGGKLMLGPFFSYNETVKIDWTWGAFFMFPKNILNQLPNQKLNDAFFMYCEDVKWCWDFHELGYDIVFLPHGGVIHYMGGSSGPKNEQMKLNHITFLKENYSFLKRWCVNLFE